jgi:hypothetical protein
MKVALGLLLAHYFLGMGGYPTTIALNQSA